MTWLTLGVTNAVMVTSAIGMYILRDSAAYIYTSDERVAALFSQLVPICPGPPGRLHTPS